MYDSPQRVYIISMSNVVREIVISVGLGFKPTMVLSSNTTIQTEHNATRFVVSFPSSYASYQKLIDISYTDMNGKPQTECYHLTEKVPGTYYFDIARRFLYCDKIKIQFRALNLNTTQEVVDPAILQFNVKNALKKDALQKIEETPEGTYTNLIQNMIKGVYNGTATLEDMMERSMEQPLGIYLSPYQADAFLTEDADGFIHGVVSSQYQASAFANKPVTPKYRLAANISAFVDEGSPDTALQGDAPGYIGSYYLNGNPPLLDRAHLMHFDVDSIPYKSKIKRAYLAFGYEYESDSQIYQSPTQSSYLPPSNDMVFDVRDVNSVKPQTLIVPVVQSVGFDATCPDDIYANPDSIYIAMKEGWEEKAIIQFDLPQHIASATVKLSLNYICGEKVGLIGIYRVTEPWDAATTSWNTRPASDSEPLVTFELPLTNTFARMDIDITPVVESIMSGQENHGWLFRLVDESFSHVDRWSHIYNFNSKTETDRSNLIMTGELPFEWESGSTTWNVVKDLILEPVSEGVLHVGMGRVKCDITDVVKGWLERPWTNNGLAVFARRDESTDQYLATIFGDNNNLVIEYDEPVLGTSEWPMERAPNTDIINSIVIDSNGDKHFLYRDKIYAILKDSDSWFIEPNNLLVVGDAKMVAPTDGKVYIIQHYRDCLEVHSRRSPRDWTLEYEAELSRWNTELPGYMGGSAISVGNDIYCVLFDINYTMKLLSRVSGEWNIETLETPGCTCHDGVYPAVRLREFGGTLYIAFPIKYPMLDVGIIAYDNGRQDFSRAYISVWDSGVFWDFDIAAILPDDVLIDGNKTYMSYKFMTNPNVSYIDDLRHVAVFDGNKWNLHSTLGVVHDLKSMQNDTVETIQRSLIVKDKLGKIWIYFAKQFQNGYSEAQFDIRRRRLD